MIIPNWVRPLKYQGIPELRGLSDYQYFILMKFINALRSGKDSANLKAIIAVLESEATPIGYCILYASQRKSFFIRKIDAKRVQFKTHISELRWINY